MFLPASTIEGIKALLESTELCLRRELAMKEILLTLGVVDVSDAVAIRVKEPDFQAKANLELAEFLRNAHELRQYLDSGGLPDLPPPQLPKAN